MQNVSQFAKLSLGERRLRESNVKPMASRSEVSVCVNELPYLPTAPTLRFVPGNGSDSTCRHVEWNEECEKVTIAVQRAD